MRRSPKAAHQTLTRLARGLAASLVVLAVSSLSLLGCGGGGDNESRSAPTGRTGRAAGAESSIETFGGEAEGSAREAILGVERSYFIAMASRDYGAACAHLATSVQHSMTELTGRPDATCQRTLPALLAPQAYPMMRRQAHGAIRKVRVDGQRAFVVFHAPGARLYQLPLVDERGEWKVAFVTASVLAPSLSTLRG